MKNKSNRTRKFTVIAFVAGISCGVITSGMAADGGNTPSAFTKALQSMTSSIQGMTGSINAAIKTHYDLMFEKDKSLDNTAMVDNQTAEASKSQTAAITNQSIKNMLAQSNNAVNNSGNNSQDTVNALANLPADDSIMTTSLTNPIAGNSAIEKAMGVYMAPSNNYFNFDNLIQPLNYGPAQTTETNLQPATCSLLQGKAIDGSKQTLGNQAFGIPYRDYVKCAYNPNQGAASTFIAFATKSYQPLFDGQALGFSKLRGKPLAVEYLKNSPTQDAQKYRNFKTKIRSMVATKSVALSNLNSILSDRTNQPGLAAKVHIPANAQELANNTDKSDASQAQVDHYTANFRTEDSGWYKQMEQASPATVQRETLFVLADIERELYKTRMQNQRLLATTTMGQLQTAQLQSIIMQTQSKDVSSAIDAAIKATSKSQDQNASSDSNEDAKSFQKDYGTGSSDQNKSDADKYMKKNGVNKT